MIRLNTKFSLSFYNNFLSTRSKGIQIEISKRIKRNYDDISNMIQGFTCASEIRSIVVGFIFFYLILILIIILFVKVDF